MKTRIVIEIETSKMKKVYDTPDSDEWNDDTDITEEVEKGIHDSFYNVIEAHIHEDDIDDSVIDNLEELWVDDWDTLSDAGEITLKIFKEEIPKGE